MKVTARPFQIVRNTQAKKKIGQYIIDIDILNAVKHSLNLGCVIKMNDIDEEYWYLLHEIDVGPGFNHPKKHLNGIIRGNIKDATFVKSHRAYESSKTVSEKKHHYLAWLVMTFEDKPMKMY